MRNPRYDGVATALCSMFNKDGSVNTGMVEEHTNFCIEGGVHTVIATAGSGQFVFMTNEQRVQTVKAVVKAAAGRVPVLAGVLEPGIGEAIESAKRAVDAGAEALLVLPPYYSSSTQDSLYDYYAILAEKVGVPMMVYNNPGRTVTLVKPATLARMMKEIPQVFGVKDCVDFPQFYEAIRLVGDDGAIFSASDYVFPFHVLAGARGGVIGASSVVPKPYVEMYNAALAGDLKTCCEMADKYYNLCATMYANGMHPSGVKYAMGLQGQPIGEWLAPLTPPDDANKETIRAELQKLGVIQ